MRFLSAIINFKGYFMRKSVFVKAAELPLYQCCQQRLPGNLCMMQAIVATRGDNLA